MLAMDSIYKRIACTAFPSDRDSIGLPKCISLIFQHDIVISSAQVVLATHEFHDIVTCPCGLILRPPSSHCSLTGLRLRSFLLCDGVNGRQQSCTSLLRSRSWQLHDPDCSWPWLLRPPQSSPVPLSREPHSRSADRSFRPVAVVEQCSRAASST